MAKTSSRVSAQHPLSIGNLHDYGQYADIALPIKFMIGNLLTTVPLEFDELEKGSQRPKSGGHVAAIKANLTAKGYFDQIRIGNPVVPFPTPIIIFCDADGPEKIGHHGETNLTSLAKTKLEIGDGQHRVATLQSFILDVKEEVSVGSTIHETLESVLAAKVSVRIFFGLNDLQKQRLFRDINSTKKISTDITELMLANAYSDPSERALIVEGEMQLARAAFIAHAVIRHSRDVKSMCKTSLKLSKETMVARGFSFATAVSAVQRVILQLDSRTDVRGEDRLLDTEVEAIVKQSWENMLAAMPLLQNDTVWRSVIHRMVPLAMMHMTEMWIRSTPSLTISSINAFSKAAATVINKHCLAEGSDQPLLSITSRQRVNTAATIDWSGSTGIDDMKKFISKILSESGLISSALDYTSPYTI